MKISVKVKLRAKTERVEKIDDRHFSVFVNAMPVDGRANLAVVRALADYFDVAPSNVQIISGMTSKQKVVEIL